MNEQVLMSVHYDRWCDKCRYLKVDENNQPCEECFFYPVMPGGKPLHFEEERMIIYER